MSDCCERCGQAIRKLNPHRMDVSKVNVLSWIGKINANFEWVKVQRDSHLIAFEERQWTIQTDAIHASRLTWFGLLERQSNRGGLYRITHGGIEFLKGNLKVPEVIYCKNGEVIERSPNYVSINEVKNVILDKEYWDEYKFYQISPPPMSRSQALLC